MNPNIPAVPVDSTVTLAIIISLCALISAPVTALINNYFQFKLRKLEIDASSQKHQFDTLFNKKVDVYSKLITALTEFREGGPYQFEDAAVSAIQSAILLCNKSTVPLLLKCLEAVGKKPSDLNALLSEVSQALNQELTNLMPSK